MISFVEKVLAYSEGFEHEAFFSDSMRYDATVRNLELIGEAETRIPEAVRNAHPEIPWRLVIATRNRLIHGYLRIDKDTLQSIIRDEISTRVPTLRKVREEVHSAWGEKPLRRIIDYTQPQWANIELDDIPYVGTGKAYETITLCPDG